MDNCIVVLIPSYNRPEWLEITLPSWLKAKYVSKIFVLAQAPSRDILEKYERVFKKYEGSGKIVYKLILKKLGSVKARNVLLDIAMQYNNCKYVVMADDDYLLPEENSLVLMAMNLESDEKVGAVGGKVIAKRRRMDPDFFLHTPINLADSLSRLTGYVFIDVKHGPRYSEFLPPFFMLKREIIDKGIRYDKLLEAPTGFREESDFQLQIKHLGFKLLFNPRVHVIHLPAEEGGNRPRMSMKERMYWKARNHAIFVFKWNKSILKRIWYLVISTLMLLLYRPHHILWIFKGLKDGIHSSIRYRL